jgi:hypothetical protein
MPEVPKSISGSRGVPSTRLVWSDDINKRVRTGDWSEQAVGTTTRIREAIGAGDWEVAAQLVDYWMEEAKVVYVVYQVWTQGFLEYLAGRGVTADECEAEVERLALLLAFPDGRPFETTTRWAELASAAGALAHRLRAFDLTAEQALADLDVLRESWRHHHDRGADFQSGLLTFVARLFGEEAVGEAYAQVLAPYLAEGYQSFDVRERPYEETLYRNLYLSFEAMRGHLVGPDRTGDMEVTEDDEKVVIAFDPCGSGNRGQRGDPIEGTPSRSEPPYNFGVTTQKHDWAWNETGICYYCAHCCYALEYWPAREWGHPLRVIDSPRYPEETSGPQPRKCTWTIYKSLEAIPPAAYERIGLSKPAADDASSAASG